MGYRIVRITGELFEHLFAEGATFPDAAGKVLRVTKGLPPGANLVGPTHDPADLATNTLSLVFAHPDWPATPAGERHPLFDVQVSLEDHRPPVLLATDLVTAIDRASALARAYSGPVPGRLLVIGDTGVEYAPADSPVVVPPWLSSADGKTYPVADVVTDPAPADAPKPVTFREFL